MKKLLLIALMIPVIGIGQRDSSHVFYGAQYYRADSNYIIIDSAYFMRPTSIHCIIFYIDTTTFNIGNGYIFMDDSGFVSRSHNYDDRVKWEIGYMVQKNLNYYYLDEYKQPLPKNQIVLFTKELQ